MLQNPSQPRQSTGAMVIFGIMGAGGITVDLLTSTMLPITARHFTDNIALISLMVALNRLCGFLVQPYAAWKSDRTRSPRGRRRPMLLVAIPVTLLCVGLLGALPFLVPPGLYRHLLVVTALFAINLVMQAFLDVCMGCLDPLYGDTFDSRDLGRASGIRGTIYNLVGIGMGLIAIPLADRNEFIPYAAVMGLLGVSWFIVGFYVRENVPPDIPPKETFKLWAPFLRLRDRAIAWKAAMVSCIIVANALNAMLHALYVTETLGLTKTHLGHAHAMYVGVCIALAYPVGFLIDHYGPRPVLTGGFTIFAVSSLGLAFVVSDAASLYLFSGMLAVGHIATNVSVMPLMFRDSTVRNRGEIFATLQMTRAAAATVATIAVGQLAHALSSYRVCYIVSALVCVAGAVGAFRWGTRQPVGSVRSAREPAPQASVGY